MTSPSRGNLHALQSVAFLNQLPHAMLAKLAPLSSVEGQIAGSVLFREADRFDRLLIVVEGLIALDMQVPRRGATRVLTVGPGEVLAWSTILGDQSQSPFSTYLSKKSRARAQQRRVAALMS